MESLNTPLARSAHGLHRSERPGGGLNVNVVPMEEGVSALPILFPNPSSLSGLASVPKETRSRLHHHLCSSAAHLPCSISARRSPKGQHWGPRTTLRSPDGDSPPTVRADITTEPPSLKSCLGKPARAVSFPHSPMSTTPFHASPHTAFSPSEKTKT